MRKGMLVGICVGLGLLVPAAPSGGVDLGPPSAAGGGESYHGFQRIQTVAQGQMGTGYFFAIGDEVNRFVGARVEVVGPPTNSRSTAAFMQRGVGATYVYGVIGGPGGTSGKLPDPPPGEAPAYYPTAPQESTFEGPVTAALGGEEGEAKTVDGRFYARAGEDASGVADATVTQVEMPGSFSVEQASVHSGSGPTADGLAGRSVSVLRGITIGPLRIESLVSTASGFVPSTPGDSKGDAETVVQGATVDKVPIKITSGGIVVADASNPGATEQVKGALAQAGLQDVRLLTSTVAPANEGQKITARAGTLDVVRRDRDFGNSNPQGVQGGGFSIGGAEVSLVGTRCQPACSAPAASSSGAGTGPVGSSPDGVPAAGAPPVRLSTQLIAANPGQEQLGADEARDVEAIYLGLAVGAAVLLLARWLTRRHTLRRTTP